MMPFEELDQKWGSRLQALPEVHPDPAFTEALKERLNRQHSQMKKIRHSRHRNRWLNGGMIAASILLIAALSYANIRHQAAILPASSPYAYALESGSSGMHFTLLDGLCERQLEFKLLGKLPTGKTESTIIKYNRSLETEEKVLKLGRLMGITAAQIKEPPEKSRQSRMVLEDKNARLSVSCSQGAWYYEAISNPAPASAAVKQSKDAKSIAVQWLQQCQLFPLDACTITETKTVPGETECLFSPRLEADELPIIGNAPRISVTVNKDGQITRANGIWFSKKESIPVSLIDFEAALKALQRGEGIFSCSSSKYDIGQLVAGQAVVEDVKMAYQLSYGLDYTPYLIPVADFSGSFSPEGGKPESFTARISLLKYQKRENAGNFKLQTTLPKAVDHIACIEEMSTAQLQAGLPAVARSLGLADKPDATGIYHGPGGQLSSLLNNWIYRSAGLDQPQQPMQLNDARILQLAKQTAERIPLPGKLGDPILSETRTEDCSLVVYPLLYSDIPVASIYAPAGSSLQIEIRRDGKITTMRCVHPMQSSRNEVSLLTAQQAWEKLLANQAQVQVEGFYGMLPGDHFVVDKSIVTEARLVYLPKHPESGSDKDYQVRYLFRGTARTGEGEIKFQAFVDAVR